MKEAKFMFEKSIRSLNINIDQSNSVDMLRADNFTFANDLLLNIFCDLRIYGRIRMKLNVVI